MQFIQDYLQDGYNGGGSYYLGTTESFGSDGTRNTTAGGGGATHIGTRNGTLAQYGNTSGLLIAAGGGGGVRWRDGVRRPGGNRWRNIWRYRTISS